MPAFEFQALDANGKTQRGVQQGDTPRAVRQALRERGLTPLSVEAVAGSASAQRERGARLGSAQLAAITRQLATLVKAGLPIDEALSALLEQNDNRALRRQLAEVRAQVIEGRPLAEALAAYPRSFPELFRASVAAGEASGHLDLVLARLADYVEQRDAVGRKLLLAMLYPAILTLVAFGVLAGLMSYVVPQVVSVFDQVKQELPWLTRLLIGISEILNQWGLALLAVLLLALTALVTALRSERFRAAWHRLLLRLPLLGRALRASESGRFARTMSMLTQSSVPVLEGLRISAQVVDLIPFRTALRRCAVRVREGVPLNRALAESGHFPPLVLRLVASGERSGALGDMLEQAARTQERELDTLLGTALAVLEPLLILVVGAMVLTIVLAILLPILSLNQFVQ